MIISGTVCTVKPCLEVSKVEGKSCRNRKTTEGIDRFLSHIHTKQFLWQVAPEIGFIYKLNVV